MAEARLEQAGDAAQDHVTHLVPVRVVDHLEVVEVHEGHRQRPAVAHGAVHLGEERGQDRAPVRHLGQEVRRGGVVGLGQLGRDVVDRALEPAEEPAPGFGTRAELAMAQALGHRHDRPDPARWPAQEEGGRRSGRLPEATGMVRPAPLVDAMTAPAVTMPRAMRTMAEPEQDPVDRMRAP